MRNYELIGLTGPSGSGKSTAAAVFRSSGYSVINADDLAREILVGGSITLRLLQETFGKDIVCENGEPNRRLIARRAFSSPNNTRLLNEITHPQIYMLVLKELKRLTDLGVRKVVFDAPALFESNGQLICDRVISVIASPEVRLHRITERDEITEEEAKQRMFAQRPDSYYISQSDRVVYNNGTPGALRRQISRLIREW